MGRRTVLLSATVSETAEREGVLAEAEAQLTEFTEAGYDVVGFAATGRMAKLFVWTLVGPEQ